MQSIKGTVNAVELIGWLGDDPELRFLSSGAAICRFSVATRRLGGQDAAGRRTYETDWTRVEAWERLAEQCNLALGKGSRVRVIGSLRTDSWVDAMSGQPRTRTYVRASDVLFLDAAPGTPSEAVDASHAEDPMAQAVGAATTA